MLSVIVVSCLGFPLPVCVFRGYRTLSKVSVNIYVKTMKKDYLEVLVFCLLIPERIFTLISSAGAKPGFNSRALLQL